MTVGDLELARRAAHGDAAAFHVIVESHGRHLLAAAMSLTGNSADAEDLVQETLLAGLQGLRHFEGRSSLRTWLISVLIRQAANWRRSRKVRRTVKLSVDLSDENRRDSQTGGGEKMDVMEAMGKLSIEYREVLLLREFGGLTYEQIAAELKLPRGTVESRIHRGRAELRELLKGYGD